MAGKKESANDAAGRELVITKLLNAPRELVWEVFTKPDHVKNWWGPNGFTNTIDEMQVREGGIWKFVMHGPDGRDYNNINRFIEVIKPERIVFEHVSHPKFTTTLTFNAEGKQTMLKWHMLFESPEQFEQVVKTFKADEGLKQNIEKLEKYLEANYNKPEVKTLTITRILDAPRKLVFKTWTDPKHMAAWWGPRGFTNPVCQMDVKPGGAIRIDMTAPDGTVYPMGGEFLEIDEPNKLVFTGTAMKGEDGKSLIENLNTITFEEYEGKTKLTLHVQVMKSEPGTEMALAGMNEGWSQSLDRLGALIKSEPLVIERTYNAPIEKLWRALTDGNEMKKWYIVDQPDFRAEVGFEFTLTKERNGREFVHLFKITEVVPGKKLKHSWNYKGYEGNSFVTFELFAEGNRTRLKLTHEGIETFPSSVPDLASSRFAEGWTSILGTSLKDFLDK